MEAPADRQVGWSLHILMLALRFANGAVGRLVGSYDASYAYADTHGLESNGLGARRRCAAHSVGERSLRIERVRFIDGGPVIDGPTHTLQPIEVSLSKNDSTPMPLP